MARNYQYDRNNLVKDSYAYIHGKIAFSRLARLIEGQALAEENQRRAQQGRKPANSPFTTVTLCNLTPESFIPNDQNSQGDQFLVEYLKERAFQSKAHPEQGVSATVEDTSGRIPNVAQIGEDKTASPVVLENDLAPGVDVYVRVKSFVSKSGNTGTGIDLVVINETGPIRYYGGGNTADLSALGLTLQGSFPQQTPAPQAQPAAANYGYTAQNQAPTGFGQAQQAQAPAGNQMQATDPFGNPGPGGIAQFTPPSQAPQAPQFQQAPQQAQVPTQANSPFTQATPFASTPTNPAGDPNTGDPWANAPANPGITYNPNQQ